MPVTAYTYAELIKAIRELALDVGPVSCFSIAKQDFLYTKAVNGGVPQFALHSALGTPPPAPVFLNISAYPKLYDMLNYMNAQGAVTSLSMDYVPDELSNMLVDAAAQAITNPFVLRRSNYFSLESIELKIYEYFRRYYTDYVLDIDEWDPETYIKATYNVEFPKIALWCAYWLIDKKRMSYAAVSYLKQNNGEPDIDTEEFINYSKNITTKLGDTHTIVEAPDEVGLGFKDFSALWGDKYSFLGKLQLYLRSKFEAGFCDYSLRENTVNSQDFILEKHWSLYAYVDTLSLSELTKDVLQASNEQPE